MHGIGFELPLQSWFDFKIPKTQIQPNFIAHILESNASNQFKSNTKVVWLGIFILRPQPTALP